MMTKKQKYTFIFILGALSALGPLSIDMYLPSFKYIASYLNTDISSVTLSLTSYFIGISIGQLIYGPITDKYGRKKPLLFGLSIFTITAIACVLSPNVNWLIGLRFILALGGCAGMVVARAVVRDAFPKDEIVKVFSMLMLIIGIAPILAPSLGGWILSVSDWKAIFYFLSGFSLLLIVLVYFFLPETGTIDKTKSLKVKQVYSDYKYVLKNRYFLYYTLASSVAMGGMFSYISGSPFVFMEYFKISESQYAMIFGLNASGFIIGSQLNRFLVTKFSSLKIVTTASVFLFFLSITIISLFALDIVTVPVLVTFLFLFLFSTGLLVPNSSAMALTPFTKRTGSASALMGFMQMLFGAVISGIVSSLHDGTTFPMIFCVSMCGVVTFIILLLLNRELKKRPEKIDPVLPPNL